MIRKFVNEFVAGYLNEEMKYLNDIWYHGTDEVFEAPKFINKGNQIGFHLGSRETALNVKGDGEDKYPKYINKYKVINLKPIRMRDLRFWMAEYIGDELIDMGIDVKKSHGGFLGSRFYTFNDILDALNDSGFNSIIYNNEYEGGGDSIIVFNENQLQFLGREKISGR